MTTTTTAVPFPPRGGAAVAFCPLERAAYVFGGIKSQNFQKTNWRLTVDDGRWAQLPASDDEPAAHAYAHAAVSVSSDTDTEFVHIIGGVNSTKVPRRTLDTFCPATGQWHRQAQNELHPMQTKKVPIAFFDASLIAFTKTRDSTTRGKVTSSYAWAVRSSFSDSQEKQQHIVEYSLSHPPLIYAKQNITAVPFVDRDGTFHGHRAIFHPKRTFLYVTGGADHNGTTSRVDVYIAKEKRWLHFPPLRTARSHHVAIFLRVVVDCTSGECTVSVRFVASGVAYAAHRLSWAMPMPRNVLPAVHSIEYLCVLGGRNSEGGPMPTMEMLDVANPAHGWTAVNMYSQSALKNAIRRMCTPLRRFMETPSGFSAFDAALSANIAEIQRVCVGLSSTAAAALWFVPLLSENSSEKGFQVIHTMGSSGSAVRVPERLQEGFDAVAKVDIVWTTPAPPTLVDKVTNMGYLRYRTVLFGVVCVLFLIFLRKRRKQPHLETKIAFAPSSLVHTESPSPLCKTPLDTLSALFSSVRLPGGTPQGSWLPSFTSVASNPDKSLTPQEGDIRNEADSIRYTRADKIGSGACGTVYKAIREDTGSVVALKVMPMDESEEDGRQQALKHALLAREVNLMRSVVSHPNLVSYYGCHFDEVNRELTIAMEFAEGGSVGALCRRLSPAPLSLTTIQKYTKQICMALFHLHSNSILHRDLKGDNVLISKDGTIKLADFGTAKRVVDRDRRPRKSSGRTKTQSKLNYSISGTPLYMAPEAFLKDEERADFFVTKPTATVDYKSDVWSLGCTVVEMINGGFPPWPPHRFPTLHAFIRTVRESKELPLYNIHVQELHPALYDFLVRRCLVKDAAERADVRELLQHPFLQL